MAYVVFKSDSSLQNALQLDSSEIRILSTEEKPVVTGVKSKYFVIFLLVYLCEGQVLSSLKLLMKK